MHVLPESAVDACFDLFPGRSDALDLVRAQLSEQDYRQFAAVALDRGQAAAMAFFRAHRRMRIRIARPASPYQHL